MQNKSKNNQSTRISLYNQNHLLSGFEKQNAILNTGIFQQAILSCTNFAIIATDAKGVIQVFNAGAVRMLGYSGTDVLNRMTPADIADQQQVVARAKILSAKFSAMITSGFESLVFNAMRGNEDTYEISCLRKDRTQFQAQVSVIALRDKFDAICGYLFHLTENMPLKNIEVEHPLIHYSRKFRSTGPRSLLYIEDNPDNMQLVEQFAARQPDIRFLSAVNGHDGVVMARSERPDVILLDINLPDMSGYKVLHLLRENPITAHIPVIALTANNQPINIDSGLLAGFFRYLTKPIKLKELMEALDSALKVSGELTSREK